MHASPDRQSLIEFFANRSLPTGPQHVNPYSVFLDLPSAVHTRLSDLQSHVDATQQSAARMLDEVKTWLLSQETPAG